MIVTVLQSIPSVAIPDSSHDQRLYIDHLDPAMYRIDSSQAKVHAMTRM